MFTQVKRGLYLAPLRLPPGKWGASPYKILDILMREMKAQYQITGLYAFNQYGLSTQVPILMTIYNTALSGRKMIGACSFQFIKVGKKRIGATDVIKACDESGDALRIPIGSLARILFDAVYDYKRFATIPAAYEWIAQKRADSNLMKKLVETTVQFGNVGTQRRVGFILTALGVNQTLCKKLWKALPKSSSLIPLIPGRNTTGSIDKQWGIIINGEYRNLSTPR